MHDNPQITPRPPVAQSARRMSRLSLVTCCLSFLLHLPSRLLIFLVRIYQWTLSPFVGRQCRFHPTCSNYFIQAVEKHGAVSGSVRGAWRILRCNPFTSGGFDPP